MTAEKAREVVQLYRMRLTELGFMPAQQPAEQPDTLADILAHCHWMLTQIEHLLDEGSMEKASGWLGFVQGCLWACRVYTVDQMRKHNRF